MRAKNPAGRLGVYKTLSDVPDGQRLANFSGYFYDRDPWAEWMTAIGLSNYGDTTKREYRILRETWTDHMAGYDRHPALADPAHVDTYVSKNNPSIRFSDRRFGRLVKWYDRMVTRTDYPHKYNPVIMAAHEYDATREVWTVWIDYIQRQIERQQ